MTTSALPMLEQELSIELGETTSIHTNTKSLMSEKRGHSHMRLIAELSEVPFDEEGERRSTCLRRRVIPESTNGWTKRCVVSIQHKLPDVLFTDLALVRENGMVTREFSYKEPDDASLDGCTELLYGFPHSGAEAQDFKYVQVITKNSWYMMLWWTLIKSGFVVMVSEYSHFAFYTRMKTNHEFESKIYFGILVFFLTLRFVVATYTATHEWQRDDGGFVTEGCVERIIDHAEGDSFSCRKIPTNLFEKLRAFFALVCFHVLGVRGLLRDLPVWLHPWKGVQQYAAFKADGARAYLLGFQHAALFKVEDEPNFLYRHGIIFLQSLLLTYLKITMSVHDEGSSGLVLAVDVIPGCFTMSASIIGVCRLWKYRGQVKAWLSKNLQSSDPKQRQVAQKLWHKHFGKLDSDFHVGNAPATPVGGALSEDKCCIERCAELAREMQQWGVLERFQDQLQAEGVDIRKAETLFAALRKIAEPALPSYCRHRGPKVDRPHQGSAKVIGYIGSPSNLQNDMISELLHTLARKLQEGGHQLYVGPPNNALEHDGVKVQDMNDAAVDMFDIVLITPGGPGTQKEAQRFERHAVLLTFVNSADELFGSPDWMKSLPTYKMFDLQAMQSVDEVVQAIDNAVNEDEGPNSGLRQRGATKTIGYIGSPDNLQNELTSEFLHALAKKLQQLGHQLYVGTLNSALDYDGVKLQDMNDVAVDMFDIVLVTPGGPDVQKEAVRFTGHAGLITFVNSADVRFGPLDWMKTLHPCITYDLQTSQSVEDVALTIHNVARDGGASKSDQLR